MRGPSRGPRLGPFSDIDLLSAPFTADSEPAGDRQTVVGEVGDVVIVVAWAASHEEILTAVRGFIGRCMATSFEHAATAETRPGRGRCAIASRAFSPGELVVSICRR